MGEAEMLLAKAGRDASFPIPGYSWDARITDGLRLGGVAL